MSLRFRGVRASLALWYVGAMVVVLALYAAVVFIFVSRSLSQALNNQLRGDFQWATAMAEQRPDGTLTWFDEDRNGGEGSQWLQAWTPDGKVFRTVVAERNPIPESERLAGQTEDMRIVAVRTAATTVRLLTGRSNIYDRRVVIQVARSEHSMRDELRGLMLLLALGLPLGVAGAGIGGYWLARRALAPVDRMAERARYEAAEYREVIASMLEEADRLASLVDRLLAFSRAELGQATLTPEAVDLQSLVQQVAADLGVLAEEKRQIMIVEATGATQGIGDRSILRQALINLVDNAIKYTPACGTICLRVVNSATGALIEVIDNGPGIPEALRSRVFDRHYRGDRLQQTVDVSGSGLGLSIAKWSVEVHGGQLGVEPASGGGSTFRITLPRPGAAAAQAPHTDGHHRQPTGTGARHAS